MRFRRRAYLYITRQNGSGDKLLVFRHPSPEAGVQTPGGTIQQDETPTDGALREALEETGLSDFSEVRLLVRDEFEGFDEKLERYFFQLKALSATPDSWGHMVSAGEADQGLVYNYYWVGLPEAEGLSEHFRAYLHLVE